MAYQSLSPTPRSPRTPTGSCCTPHKLPSFFEPDLTEVSQQQWRRTTGRHVRAGTIILDHAQKKVLLIQSYKRFWGLPKGHVEADEKLIDCAIRETFEETGLRLSARDLTKSYTVYNGDGVYFVVNGTGCRVDPNKIVSTQEITGITWMCLDCIYQLTLHGDMLINSHLRALLSAIRRELQSPRSPIPLRTSPGPRSPSLVRDHSPTTEPFVLES
jgi:8-oxo-dGTP pyrophosphatase MutT (NUDIX family)